MTKLKVDLQKDIAAAIKSAQNLKTPKDVADLLEVPLGQLLHILYKIPHDRKFKTFNIRKKTGDMRTIRAPIGSKKILQNKLTPILQGLYRTKSCVHGFVPLKSVVSNAQCHRKQRYVLNIDLNDFFHSIHFGRIRGLFIGYPFHMDERAAAIMAQVCTHDGVLPQGASTSPVLSNLIVAGLDKKMVALAKRYKLTYSRYADDLTFSTSQKNFPRSIASWDGDNPITNEVVLGDLIQSEIESTGFSVNYNKVRLQIRSVRQEVTGITVNEFPNVRRHYIRNIRAMFHAWEKFGLKNAENELIEKYAKSPPNIDTKDRNGKYFKNVLYGKIAFVKMVRGEDDDIYMKLCLKAASLDTNPPKFIQKIKIMHEKFDVFLSHASEDKESTVRPIHEELQKLGVSAFLDEVNMEWGDSLTEKINHALGQSKFVLAVLSKSSLGKKWPEKEINAELARELAGKQKILPLIVGSPDLSTLSLLEDKLYLKWDNNAEKIALKIQNMLL